MHRKLSIVVPAYNEAECIERFTAAVFALPLENPLELVFVDDGSADATLSRIRAAAAADARVRYVSFSRNFGKEAALLAGLRHATGELVVTMDADLQHDPKLLVEMARAIEDEGYDSAAACRTTRTREPKLRSGFARCFYGIMTRLSDVRLRDGIMDYRMMSRQVADAVLSLGERVRFTKGIYEWVGFKTKYIECVNVERTAGSSKWSIASLFRYSLGGLTAFSTAPLQVATALGVVLAAPSLAAIAYFLVKAVCVGYASFWLYVSLFFLLAGLQFLVVGVLGLYIAGIFREVKGRPVYVVKESK